MRKPSTTGIRQTGRLKDRQLAVGLDLGDRSSFYCVLNGAGEVIVEAKVATNPEAMTETFGKMPRSRIALETGTLAMGKSVVIRARARNHRGALTQCPLDRGKSAEGRPSPC
jgi:predicted NBD/HSP70 family sugar kinase